MRQRFESLRSDITTIAGECMLEYKEEITGLLVTQQFDEHVDSEGNPLRPYFVPYQKHKELSGKSGKTDFDETGAMHGEMYLRVDGPGDEYEINSPAQTDKGELKSDWLNEWNGSETMTLTKENKEIAGSIIMPDFVERVNQYLAG
jgi:hypothetical protein